MRLPLSLMRNSFSSKMSAHCFSARFGGNPRLIQGPPPFFFVSPAPTFRPSAGQIAKTKLFDWGVRGRSFRVFRVIATFHVLGARIQDNNFLLLPGGLFFIFFSSLKTLWLGSWLINEKNVIASAGAANLAFTGF